MKKILFVILFACLILSICVSAQEYDGSIYRINDFVGVITDEDVDIIDDIIAENIEPLETDFPIYIFDTLDENTELREHADAYYEHNNYGYGEDKSGIFLVFDLKNQIYAVYYYGKADEIITSGARTEILNTVRASLDDESKNNADVFKDYLEKAFECVKTANKETEPEDKSDKENGMPYWYADDVNNFKNFHAENPKRVVDDADVFTPEQEAYLSEKVQEIVDKYGFGYVLFTDNSTHGLSQELYSADFLYYNGYGTGENYSAVCFFLSLEEGNRGWRTTSINDCEKIFTSSVCYDIDELVDSDFRSGNYYEAFRKQVEFTAKLFEDINNLPEWYPEGVSVFDIDRYDREYAEKADLSKKRIVDNAILFSEDEIEVLSEKIGEIVEESGFDFVIFTDTSRHGLDFYEYAWDFYYYNGYAKDGAILFVSDENGILSWITVPFGKAAEKLEDTGINTTIVDDMYYGNMQPAMEKYLQNLSFAYKHGRLKMSAGKKIEYAVIGLIAGFIISLVVVSGLKRKMVIKPETSAMEYLVPGSFALRSQRIKFLYSTVTRTAKESSHSSGSGGGSSYSSGSASSGGSYSSGGRNF
ncbi:MAG: TPM domain-containing protein [Clostridia bacterium]|nr:TPM domain-containing protein [Clostridia bacterium]